jgi:hypothetical protein
LVYLADPWKPSEGPVEAVFFLKPATEAVLKLPDRLRRQIYQLLVSLLREAEPHSRDEKTRIPAGQVCISIVSGNNDSALRIAHAQLKEQLVIMQVATSAEAFHRKQLEMDFDVLCHVSLTDFGVRIEARPEDPAVVELFDHAIDLYCRSLQRRVTGRMGSELQSLFKKAEQAPQHIVQGNKNFVLVERSQLQALVTPRNAFEVYQSLCERSDSTEHFDLIPGTPLAPLPDLN